jgi:dienelactone hydrolase
MVTKVSSSRRSPRVRRGRRSRGVVAGLGALVLLVVASGCIPPAGTVPISSPPAPAGCITGVGPADKLVFTGCGGDITYNVSVPAVCATKACGLILDVHGWTMSGDKQEANTQIAAIGRQEGYVVVQPSAPLAGEQPSWNSSHYPRVAAFVEEAVGVWRIDRRRVHVTGFSQGGAMTNWMRCNRTDLFASAAPSAMGGGACTNGRNLPTMYVQGLDDVFVSQAAIDATIASYVTTHDLDRSVVLFDEEGVVFTAYASTAAPDTPTFVTVIHDHTSALVRGHCIFGAPNVSDPYGCDEPSTRSHGRMIVDFFKGHPKAS